MINNHPLITILLPTYNCASIIKRTLDSISWADEIIVVDSYSDDSTCNIALEYGAKIFQHEYINSAKQKNWALQFCSNEWIFQIDSDEELEANVETIIRTAVNNAHADLHCFKVFNPTVGKSILRSCFFFGNLTNTPLFLNLLFLNFMSIF